MPKKDRKEYMRNYMREYMRGYGPKWQKENTRPINFRFNLKKDADILKMLDQVPSMLDYVRGLIRADMLEKGISFDDDDE